MVSKIAVMALVAVIAVPIMLGYAMNFNQVTETIYEVNEDPVNVTQLLQTDTADSYTNGDTLGNNTQFGINTNSPGVKPSYSYMPMYQGSSSTRTSLKLTSFSSNPWTPGGTVNMNGMDYYYFHAKYNNPTVNSVTIQIYGLTGGTETLWRTYNNVQYFEWDANSTNTPGVGTFTVGVYTGGWAHFFPYTSDITRVVYSGTAGLTAEVYGYYNDANSNSYINIAAGYRFSGESNATNYNFPTISFPSFAKSTLMSINLDSITASNYYFDILQDPLPALADNYIRLTKTTTAGIVSWNAALYVSGSLVDEYDLYYDQSRTDNTYQIYTERTTEKTDNPSWKPVDFKVQFNYVGSWPSLIGKANYYHSYDFEFTQIINRVDRTFIAFKMQNITDSSPIVRIDDSLLTAFEYPVISNKTYDPSSFKANPSTTLNDPIEYGDSLSFGGNTYPVKNGEITIGTHKVPVKGLVLSSVPNDLGTYDNKIGNTIVSTTAAPSDITFNGQWGLSVTTKSMSPVTVTKTEWSAGDFAWDGIDQNFIMAGLLASLGAFVGVGIYARRTRSSVWPLLIVCGGAALLFFVML